MSKTAVVARPNWAYPKWAKVRVAVYARDRFTCRMCGWAAPNVPPGYDGRRNVPSDFNPDKYPGHLYRRLEIDHFIAISRGGDNSLENLRTICDLCNMRKGCRVAA